MVLQRQSGRPLLRDRDRLVWMCLRRLWHGWHRALVVVKPATVVKWHCKGFRAYWRWKSQPAGGRPRIDREIRELIRDMWRSNPTWGKPRIQAELRQDRHRGKRLHGLAVPATSRQSALPELACVLGQPRQGHRRDRLLRGSNGDVPRPSTCSSSCPTTGVASCRDRDGIFGTDFVRCVESMGITEVVTAPASPWQNPYCERLIGSIRRECLDHVIVLNERHLRRVLRGYASYYHSSRTHRSLDDDCPDPRPAEPPEIGDVVVIAQVGGLHHRYTRRLAA